MFALSLASVLWRVIVPGARSRDEAGEQRESIVRIELSWSLLLSSAFNVLLKIVSLALHGLLAVKWLLAGEQAGCALASCFALVAVNTQLLVSVALIAHLRTIAIKTALRDKLQIKFSPSKGIIDAPAGQIAILINIIATGVLLVDTHDHPGVLAWLSTAAGLLIWANSSFQSVGIMSSQTWEEMKSTMSESLQDVSVVDFLRTLRERLKTRTILPTPKALKMF